jgi:membrane dipeptidase
MSTKKGTMTEDVALRLHGESVIIDGLNASHFLEDRVLERLHRGGVTAANATIAAWHGPLETINLIAEHLARFDQHASSIMPVRTADDILTAKATNRVGMIFGFQDTAPIGDNLRLLAIYHALGVRVIQLTYNFENRVGCGCQAAQDTGLTPFGRAVIAEMNRLGILVDLSHCGPRTTMEAIEGSHGPVAITHANPRALLDHPRNKSDDVIRALAAKGGVIGAVGFFGLLARGRRATLDDYLDAIDYLANLVGVDHVALGSDFMEEMPPEVAAQVLQGLSPAALAQFTSLPPTQDFESVALLPNVTRGLLARGYTPEHVRKIIGENWLRLYRQTWRSIGHLP